MRVPSARRPRKRAEQQRAVAMHNEGRDAHHIAGVLGRTVKDVEGWLRKAAKDDDDAQDG